MTPSAPPIASVILPTRNRKAMLRVAIQSSLRQSVPVEVIVVDDGSTDGTGEMVCSEFPQVKYVRYDGPKGPSFLRNRGAERATTEFLFPIDDDAEFVSSNTIEQTIAEFSNPRVAAVGIPYINVRLNPTVNQRAPNAEQLYLTAAFVGAAHAVKRSKFLAAGGYREELFYMGEEGDLCLRLLARGYVTRLGRGDPIHHHESPIRNSVWADLYGRRNDVLSAWYNAPLPLLPGRWMSATVNGLLFGAKIGRPLRMLRGLAWGYGSVLKNAGQRSPVDAEIYQLFRELSRRSMTLSDVESRLPPMK